VRSSGQHWRKLEEILEEALEISTANLQTRSRRVKLASRDAVYWVGLGERGKRLGYRRAQDRTAGVWMARLYAEGKWIQTRLGFADDLEDADESRVLTLLNAKERALAWFPEARRTAQDQPTHGGKFKVNDALDEYFAEHRSDGKKEGNVYRQECAANAHIRPALGEIAVERLTMARLKKWMGELAAVSARKRSRRGTETAYRDAPVGEDKQRARRDTANRILSVLKAALSLAVSNRRVAAGCAPMWREVKPFPYTTKARTLFLSDSEQRAFIGACEGDFGQLARAGFYCGARYGELRQLLVRDFDKAQRTLYVASGIAKNKKARHIHLDQESLRFFSGLAAGRPGEEPLFLRDARRNPVPENEERSHPRQWGQSEQARPMREACVRAGYRHPFPFYTLRHSCAARWLATGAPMVYVAAQLGNSVAICEKYYGHLSQGHLARVMRAMPGLKLPSARKRPSQAKQQSVMLEMNARAERSKPHSRLVN
jgi:integrase